MKAALTAFWRLFHALAFYPIVIGIFIWLYIKDAHWILGLAIIVIILAFDGIWRVLFQSFILKFRKFIARNK